MCAGYPSGLPSDRELLAGQHRKRDEINTGLARDMAIMWGGHLQKLELHTPPLRYGSDALKLLKALPSLPDLTIHGTLIIGADSVIGRHWGTPGLSGNLECLQNISDLRSVRLHNHPELTDISHLSKLDNLHNLTLVGTGVQQWPASMSSLNNLGSIRIEQDSLAEISSPLDHSQVTRRMLLLPDCFVRCQPNLWHLSLKNHIIVLDGIESLEPLKDSLNTLQLDGCDFLVVRNGAVHHFLENGISDTKPLQGLRNVRELDLSRFAPISGGLKRWPDMLCSLGVTSMALLEDLDLSSNGLENVPEQLSVLTGLTSLELCCNKLLPDAVLHPAILQLSKLRYIQLDDCLPTCIVAALRADTHYRQNFECIQADQQYERDRAAKAAGDARELVERLYEPPDLSRLKQACPGLEYLSICNAA